MRKLFILLPLIMLGSCASMMAEISYIPIRAAWLEQPKGARAALVRCVYEISMAQCGSDNVHSPAVSECLKLQVQEYKLGADDKTAWLVSHGCSEDRAQLRDDEI